jgi:hypothetical protein
MRLLNSCALILICSVLALPSDTDVIPPCGSSMTPERAFERATAVFVGRVLSIQTLNTPRTRAGSTTVYHEVKLEVEKSWKLVDRRETSKVLAPLVVKEIVVGFRVGYENPSYFSRDYKKQFGAPPQRDIARLRCNLEV